MDERFGSANEFIEAVDCPPHGAKNDAAELIGTPKGNYLRNFSDPGETLQTLGIHHCSYSSANGNYNATYTCAH